MSYYFDEKRAGSVCAVGVEKNDPDAIIYLHKGTNKNKKKYNFNYVDYEKEIKKSGVKRREKQYILSKLEDVFFENMNESDIEDGNEGFKNLYKHVKENEEKKSKFIADSKIIPMIRDDWFNVVFINGPSGAGKSKIAVNMVQQYLKHNKKIDVFLVSKKSSDKTIDQIKRIKKLDVETFLDDPITIDEFPDKSVIIFDDFEQFETTNKKLYVAIMGLLKDLVTLGRTKLLQVFIITHSSAIGRGSTLLYSEAQWLVLYPLANSYHSLKLVLQDKVGLDMTQIKYIKNLKSKYVVIHKSFPRFLISGDTIEFI